MKKARRRTLSLRFAIILLTLSSIAIGWFVMAYRKAEEQRVIVEQLHQEGYVITYDYFRDFIESPKGIEIIRSGDDPLRHATPYGPYPLRVVLGRDFFNTVVSCDTYAQTTQNLSPSTLTNICKLKGLRSLTCSGQAADDIDWSALEKLTRLEQLYLDNLESVP